MTLSAFGADLPANSRVILLDSSSIIKSCFEGYQATRTSSYNGRAMDVAGLYGYLYRTMKVYEGFEFEAMVHVMDPPGGSHHRYSIYPEYKANRKPKDPLLAAQEALMEPMLRAFGERYTCMRGVESDDVLATMAEYLADMGHQVMVITPDKDLMQLVSDGRISVARYVDIPGGVGKTYAMFEEKEVLDVMGVRADQVADFLALVGDSSDNIPGVFKCGPKTAAKWLSDYGDLASLMTHSDDIGGKIGESLRATLPHLPLYQKLTTVLRDVPNTVWPEIPEVDDEHHATMREVLVLPSTFPARFGIGGAHTNPAPAQLQAPKAKPRANGTPTNQAPAGGYQAAPAPSAGFTRPAHTPAAAMPQATTQATQRPEPPRSNPDGLVALTADPLDASVGYQRRESLGEALSQEPDSEAFSPDDPFAALGLMDPDPQIAADPTSEPAATPASTQATPAPVANEAPAAQGDNPQPSSPAADEEPTQAEHEGQGRASSGGRPPRLGRR